MRQRKNAILQSAVYLEKNLRAIFAQISYNQKTGNHTNGMVCRILLLKSANILPKMETKYFNRSSNRNEGEKIMIIDGNSSDDSLIYSWQRLSDFDEDQLNYFFESISELKEKLLALLIQLPPSIDIVEGLDALRNIIPYLDKGFRYAVEVRQRSWFQDFAYNFFRNNQMCLVWSHLADIRTPPIVTSDFVYVRLIGDRSIQERNFGRIQIDRIKEMKKVAYNFKKDSDESNLSGVTFSIVAANNHYAGFGPGTVNIFRQLLGLEEVKWGEEFVTIDDPEKDNGSSMNKRVLKTKQTSLSDF